MGGEKRLGVRSGESKDYLSAYAALTSGTQITMYSENGKIVAIYSTAGATTVDSDAVVVMCCWRWYIAGPHWPEQSQAGHRRSE